MASATASNLDLKRATDPVSQHPLVRARPTEGETDPKGATTTTGDEGVGNKIAVNAILSGGASVPAKVTSLLPRSHFLQTHRPLF